MHNISGKMRPKIMGKTMMPISCKFCSKFKGVITVQFEGEKHSIKFRPRLALLPLFCFFQILFLYNLILMVS